jgi:hypothetical protein
MKYCIYSVTAYSPSSRFITAYIPLLHIVRALGLSATIKQQIHNKTTKSVGIVRLLRFLAPKIDMRVFVILGHLQMEKVSRDDRGKQ